MENQVTYREGTTNHLFADGWRRMSWGAIFAGVLVAIVTQLALTLLGIGIGLSTVDATEEHNPVAGLGTGSAIWYTVTTLIALFAGGWVAGRMARSSRATDSVIHGIVMWSLVTVFSFYLLTTTVGNIVGGVGRLVGGTMRTVGAATATGVLAASSGSESGRGQGLNLDDLRGEINQLLSQTGQPGLQPGALGNRTEKAVDKIIANPQSADDVIRQFFGSGGTGGQVDREAMVNLIAARTGKSRQEASQIADNWVATYNQAQQQWEQTKVRAEQQAREAADDAARALSTASILAFVGLVLGAAVSGFAAKKGRDSAELVTAGTSPATSHNPQARY